MPYARLSELPKSVRDALPKHGQEIYMAAFNAAYGDTCKDREDRDACAAAIAWSAVKAKYEKEDGQWKRKEIDNIQVGNIEIFSSMSAPSTISDAAPTHRTTLQRLDSVIKSGNGHDIYDTDAFVRSVDRWVGVPVIYSHANGRDISHPDFEAVENNTLDPDRYQVVGKIARAWVSEEGEPVLMADIVITDPEIDQKVNAGLMSLSTGFTGWVVDKRGEYNTIGGDIIPNHILIFERGACKTCYPNDNSARFMNNTEDKGGIMADTHENEETKSLLKSILNALTKHESQEVEEDNTKKEEVKSVDIIETEEYKELLAERDKLKEELTEVKNRIEQDQKESEWTKVKNTVPAGWLGEKEAETRELYETNPAEFVIRLTEHNNRVPGDVDAEGNTESPDVTESTNTLPAGTLDIGHYDFESGSWIRGGE